MQFITNDSHPLCVLVPTVCFSLRISRALGNTLYFIQGLSSIGAIELYHHHQQICTTKRSGLLHRSTYYPSRTIHPLPREFLVYILFTGCQSSTLSQLCNNRLSTQSENILFVYFNHYTHAPSHTRIRHCL